MGNIIGGEGIVNGKHLVGVEKQSAIKALSEKEERGKKMMFISIDNLTALLQSMANNP